MYKLLECKNAKVKNMTMSKNAANVYYLKSQIQYNYCNNKDSIIIVIIVTKNVNTDYKLCQNNFLISIKVINQVMFK